MITHQPYPTDVISIVPPRDAEADSMTSLEAVRARFARNQGLPFADVLDRSQHPRRPRRARRQVPRPGVQPGHHHLGLPQPGAQRRPQLPRRRVADHRPPGRQRPGGLLAQHRQLLQRPRPPPHRRPAHPGQADRPAVAGRRPPRSGSGTGGTCSSPTARTSPCPTRRRTRRPTRSRRCSSRGSASRWPGSPCCCRWRPAPATTWPSRRTRARAPARPRCCGRCTTRSQPGDVVLADALFDNYFLACELRQRGIELVARVQAERVGSRTVREQARRRHHRLAAAQQAARHDGGAVPHATPRAC